MHHGIHHFHGTPVWGSAGDVHRIAVSGAGAFVSYVRPDQIAASIQHAQVVGIDNGAFSAWVRGLKINWSDFYKWLLNYYHHPKVAFFVIPDVVDGGERDNDALINEVPKMFYGKATPVWHLHESIDRLIELCREWPRVCFGSSGEYAATRREKSWHKTTVGEVVKEIAVRHKLKMALGKDLSDKPVEHIDQTNESDGSFLMRLARQYGAIASVKNGNLLFIRQGQGKSASGKPLPVITITRKDGDSHRFTLADRGAYTGVIASWLHTREPAKNESTTVKRKRRTKKQKKEPEAKQGDYLVGTDENVLVLNRTYANRSNAERAAKMQWERLQRGVASFSLQLAEGRADLYTEMPVKVSGFKQPIDDAEWTITTLTHTVSPDNGFTTSLELEVRIDDFEME